MSNIRDYFEEKARSKDPQAGQFAVALAIMRLADVLDYSPSSPSPHPLEFIGMKLGEIAEAVQAVDLGGDRS